MTKPFTSPTKLPRMLEGEGLGDTGACSHRGVMLPFAMPIYVPALPKSSCFCCCSCCLGDYLRDFRPNPILFRHSFILEVEPVVTRSGSTPSICFRSNPFLFSLSPLLPFGLDNDFYLNGLQHQILSPVRLLVDDIVYKILVVRLFNSRTL